MTARTIATPAKPLAVFELIYADGPHGGAGVVAAQQVDLDCLVWSGVRWWLAEDGDEKRIIAPIELPKFLLITGPL